MSSFLYVSFFSIDDVGRVSKFNMIRKMKHKEGGNKAYLPIHYSVTPLPYVTLWEYGDKSNRKLESIPFIKYEWMCTWYYGLFITISKTLLSVGVTFTNILKHVISSCVGYFDSTYKNIVFKCQHNLLEIIYLRLWTVIVKQE